MATRAQLRAALARRVAERTRDLTINAAAEIAAATPVDTGFARANWQITIGAPATGTVTAPSLASLEGYDPERDGSTFITNNANYIQRLNGGHSQQAPAGFVEAAIAKAVAS
mgnify:CR=1 FL=1